MPADPLGLSMRRRLWGLLARYPGLHLREAARQLGTSLALVEYHVAVLRETGLLNEDRTGAEVRLYAVATGQPGPSAREREALRLLRRPVPLRIVMVVLDSDRPLRHKEIAHAIAAGKSTVSFHLRKLEKTALLQTGAEGVEPVDRRRLLDLLLRYEPTPDLLAGYGDVWRALYDAGRAK